MENVLPSTKNFLTYDNYSGLEVVGNKESGVSMHGHLCSLRYNCTIPDCSDIMHKFRKDITLMHVPCNVFGEGVSRRSAILPIRLCYDRT